MNFHGGEILSDIALLPCAVCGSAAVAGASTNPGGPTTVWVGCPACGARTFDAKTFESAAAAWNRRPAPIGPLGQKPLPAHSVQNAPAVPPARRPPPAPGPGK
jgi:Restriction alleviation protein Lar